MEITILKQFMLSQTLFAQMPIEPGQAGVNRSSITAKRVRLFRLEGLSLSIHKEISISEVASRRRMTDDLSRGL